MSRLYMNYILLAVCVTLVGVQSLLHKQYAIESHDPISVHLFNLFAAVASVITVLAAVLISGDGLTAHTPTIIYGVIFGIGFVVTTSALNICIESGSMSLTNLIMSFSVVLPTIWAVLFLGDRFRLTTGIGFVLLVFSLFLFNYRNETLEVNRKWLIWVIILFAANGGCAVMQKIHQTDYPGLYQREYLLIGMSIYAAANLFIVLFYKDKSGLKNAVKYGILLAAPEGVANVIANMLVMMLNSMISATVEYPAVAAGSIIWAFIWAVFIYKEKMSKIQTAGVVIAVASIIILNI